VDILIKESDSYVPYPFTKEIELERLVVKLSSQIFGDASVYLDVKKGLKGSGILSIPDAYLIDMVDPNQPKIYIIENEIVTHDPFKHIGVQLLKFSIAYNEAKTDLRKFIMEKIQEDKNLLKKVESACQDSSARNIDNFLDKAINDGFHALIIIDEARPELHSIREKINADINILELKAFTNGSDFIYATDTLYGEEESVLPATSKRKATPPDRKYHKAQCDTIVVPAQEEGFQRVFLHQNQWHAVRISAAMKSRIKYIAAYQVHPISAITHVAEIKNIMPYGDSGKYLIVFENSAKEISPIPLGKSSYSPRGAFYTKFEVLQTAKNLNDLF
jgi:hypothetical protein